MKHLEQLTEEQLRQLEKTRGRVIESIGKNMDLYGITLSIGHLYGQMYFSQEPVTLDDLSASMGMSKTSMSTGVRTLMDLKMIDKVWEKGSRKDLYEVVPDWHQNFSDYFSVRWRKAVEGNMGVINKSLAEIGTLIDQHQDSPAFVSVLQTDADKIKAALQYYRWLIRLIESFESGKIYDYIPKEE